MTYDKLDRVELVYYYNKMTFDKLDGVELLNGHIAKRIDLMLNIK